MKQAQLIVTTSRNVKPLTVLLLTQNKTQFYKVLSFDQYKNTYLIKRSIDRTNQLWNDYKTLVENKDNFPRLGPQFDYVTFVDDLVNTYQQIKANGVTIDEFKANDPLQHEVIEIFRLLDDITIDPTIEIAYAPNAQCDFTIAERYADQALLDRLYRQAIFSPLDLGRTKDDPTINYELSLGLNSTIETIIDEIIHDHLDVHDINLILADQNQIKSAISVLDSYHIPHDQVDTNDQTICIDALLHMIHYGKTKALADLYHILNLGYQIENMEWTITAMDKTIHTVDQSPLDPTIPYIDKLTLAKHNQLLECLNHAAVYFDHCFAACSSTKALIETSFDLIQASPLNNTKALKQIADLYNLINDDLNTDHGYRFFEQRLSMVKPSSIEYPFDAMVVTTITQPVSPRKISYIVGLNSANYPGFAPLNGIIDERFIKSSSYPSLAARQAFQTKRLAWLDHSGQTIHYRFCRLDNTAKPMDLPFAFLNKTFVTIHPLNRPAYSKINTCIDSPLDHMQKKDGLIKASISSLESFDRCPFQYALSSMVHLRRPNPLFSSAMMGSLMHQQMQQVISNPMHQDQHASNRNIKADLSSLFNDPKQFQLMLKNISSLIDDVANRSRPSSERYLSSEACELTIEHRIANFAFKGIIDRLDAQGRQYGIVDYKTSSHHLSKALFELGEQLQLISYAYLYECSHDALLSYLDYVCLTPQSQSFEPYTIVKKTLQKRTADDYLAKCYETKRYDGKKMGAKNIPWASIKRMVEPLYRAIYAKLASPNYAPAPSAKTKPCDFCAFKSICRYNGPQINKQPYITIEPTQEEVEASKHEVE